MLLGLVSAYREGRLGEAAARSLLEACDRVIVAEGPVAGLSCDADETDWPLLVRESGQRLAFFRGEWSSDAEKRTSLLGQARRYPGCRWGVILDGDELLVDGRYLPEYFDALHPDALGFSLHLMELDGSCSYIPNRVLRLDKIERWLVSSYCFELEGGIVVERGNIPILRAGEPDAADWIDTGDGERQRRRPVAGEPHILHRSVLRSPARRELRRMNEEEAETVAALRGLREAARGGKVTAVGSPRQGATT